MFADLGIVNVDYIQWFKDGYASMKISFTEPKEKLTWIFNVFDEVTVL